jgi:hypothetical protein
MQWCPKCQKYVDTKTEKFLDEDKRLWEEYSCDLCGVTISRREISPEKKE